MNNLKIVKASAWYDLLVTAPFAFPLIVELSISTLSDLHEVAGFSGQLPEFQPLHLLFINLMGSIVLVWSVLRIRHPSILLGLYDAHARTLFSLWMIHALAGGSTPLIYAFLIPEISWGIVQYCGFWKSKVAKQMALM